LKNRRIFLSCGDPSGDFHAARLVPELRKRNAVVHALGGRRTEAAGAELLENIVKESVVGFWESLKKFGYYRGVLEKTKKYLTRNPADALLLVDFWGFNSHLGEWAGKRGIPVYYYISPQVWASREGRAERIKRWVRKMFVVFPFEEDFYRKKGIPVRFVGHPLLDVVPPPLDALPQKVSVGVLPGSRNQEVKSLFPLFCELCGRLRRDFTGSEFFLFAHPDIDWSEIEIPGYFTKVSSDEFYEKRRELLFALTASGTATLENTLLGIPMAVFYRLSFFTYQLARRLVRVPYIGMPNILSGKLLVPEFIQHLDPELIYPVLKKNIENRAGLTGIREELLKLRGSLGRPGVAERVAGCLLDDL